MPSLTAILEGRAPAVLEDNLEVGKIWTFSQNTTYSTCTENFCWNAPSNGTVVVEAWGAGGSAARQCCCTATISGNSGAYVCKTGYAISGGDRICGFTGKSCRNAGSLCFRGCSQATCVCYTGASNGCICAQGGRGAVSWCTTGTARACCYAGSNWCNTTYQDYCRLICNSCPSAWCGCGYGGDYRVNSVLSCVTFWHCYPNCNCSTVHHTAIPGGYFSTNGGVATYQLDADNGNSEWSGMTLDPFINALNGMGRMPKVGSTYTSCWNGERHCGCRDVSGCANYVPHGAGGPAATPCSGVRDNGYAGGDGLVRIKFIEG